MNGGRKSIGYASCMREVAFKYKGGNLTVLEVSYLVGLWPSCQHIICPDVVLTMTITGLMRAQIFPCDSDIKLKQPVPICSAIFKLLLCGGVYQRSFAKTYLLAKCFTIICRVHELKRTSLKRTSRRATRISMEEVYPDRAIQALHLIMRWGLLLCNSLVLKILPKAKNKLQYKQNITLENQLATNTFSPNQTKKQKAPTTACPETPIPNPNYTKVIHLGHYVSSGTGVKNSKWKFIIQDRHSSYPACYLSLPAPVRGAYKLRTLTNPSICPVF